MMRRLFLIWLAGFYLHVLMLGFAMGYSRYFTPSPALAAIVTIGWPVHLPFALAGALGEAMRP
jgi:hypothetical protein